MARTRETAAQAGLGRDDRRSIAGGRWEHDFDNTTTWRNQFVFDDRNINQPTGSTTAIGDYPSYNYMSDVTKRGELLGMDSTTFLGGFYNTLAVSGDTRNVMPGGNATLGSLSSNLYSVTTNYGLRAREELKLTSALTAIAGVGWGNHRSKGHQHGLHLHGCRGSLINRDHLRGPAIPEYGAGSGLVVQAQQRLAASCADRHRIWHASGLEPVRFADRPVRQ